MTAERDFGEILRSSARHHHDRIAVSRDAEHQTYSALFERLSSRAGLGRARAEVCVVGVPQEKWATIDEAEIIAHCRDRVGAVHKVTAVEVVEVVEELPKSGVGKVLRRLVRDRHWVGRESGLGRA